MSADDGIDVGYKGLHANVRGPLGIIAMLLALIGGSLIYVGHQGFADVKELLRQSSADHDLLSCVVSLSARDREDLRQATSRVSFQRLCPWLRP